MRLSPLLVVALLTTIACQQDASPTPNVSATTLPNNVKPDSLDDLCKRLDDVYAKNFQPTADKIAPHEKALVDKLTKNEDASGMAKQDSQLYKDGIDAANKFAIVLSTSTSATVAPIDHDNYAAYYTAISMKAASRKDEYQAILKYADKPTADNAQTVLSDARTVTGQDLTYNQVKR